LIDRVISVSDCSQEKHAKHRQGFTMAHDSANAAQQFGCIFLITGRNAKK
jgi:hypothetical protein